VSFRIPGYKHILLKFTNISSIWEKVGKEPFVVFFFFVDNEERNLIIE
jgi:hypothetical protein